ICRILRTMKARSDKKLLEQLNELTQEAVDKAIEKHRLRGESIAISGEQGKVKIISADRITPLLVRMARGSETLTIKKNNHDK
ncbi:MAG: hypothetical protein AAGA16_18560, partial [Cyanobacteria bacterium P01_E01_bin.35]